MKIGVLERGVWGVASREASETIWGVQAMSSGIRSCT